MSDCSTHAFDVPLKPCPFCGGEAEIVVLDDWYKNPPIGVGCSQCSVILAEYGEYKRFTTEAEAIAAWNSRADYHGYEQAAIEAWENIKAWNSRAERTCEVVKGKCSNCGKDLPEDPYSDYEGNYCPSCGARVIGG